MNAEKFLAITAMLAGVGVAAACSDTDEPATGTGGAAGAGGSGGSGGQAGTSGAAGASGDGGAPQCLGDTAQSDVGVESICDTLPYAAVDCSQPDAGAEAPPIPYGSIVCWQMSGRLRDGVMEGMLECLAKVGTTVTDACSSEHDAAVADCYTNTLALACEQPETKTACTTITTACTAITMDACESTLNAFMPADHAVILKCISDGANSGDSCDEVVANCIRYT
jgi:hypothetical protein